MVLLKSHKRDNKQQPNPYLHLSLQSPPPRKPQYRSLPPAREMIHHLELALRLRKPLFPQQPLPFRLYLFNLKFVENPRDGQSEFNVSNGFTDASARANREGCECAPSDFDLINGGLRGEPALGVEAVWVREVDGVVMDSVDGGASYSLAGVLVGKVEITGLLVGYGPR